MGTRRPVSPVAPVAPVAPFILVRPMEPVGPGGPIDQNWRGEHRLPLLRLNRRVIRYDLGELMAWRQKQGRFFDIATLLSSTNAIGFSEIVGLIRISIGLDVLLPAKLLTQSRFD